jgi:hypothetical protein
LNCTRAPDDARQFAACAERREGIRLIQAGAAQPPSIQHPIRERSRGRHHNLALAAKPLEDEPSTVGRIAVAGELAVVCQGGDVLALTIGSARPAAPESGENHRRLLESLARSPHRCISGREGTLALVQPR